jgi:hypothetical protein
MILVLIGLLVFLIILTIGFHFLTIKKYKIIMFLLRDDLAEVITKLTENSFETLKSVQRKDEEFLYLKNEITSCLKDLKDLIEIYNQKIFNMYEEMNQPQAINTNTDEILLTEIRKIGQQISSKVDSLSTNKNEIVENIQDVKNIIINLKSKPKKKKEIGD